MNTYIRNYRDVDGYHFSANYWMDDVKLTVVDNTGKYVVAWLPAEEFARLAEPPT